MVVHRYGILGPTEVLVGDRAIPLAGAGQRLLLSALLLSPNQAVPADRLAEIVWGDAQPVNPAAALRNQVSRLRRSLGSAGPDLATVDRGYLIRLERDRLDAARFEDLFAQTEAERGQRALALVDEALGLWRGPALDTIRDRLWAAPDAARLDELRVAAEQRRAELLLSLGKADEAIAALRAIVSAHPEREGARGQLMRALYEGGRPTEALTTYRVWQRRLADELGLDPSPELRRIEYEILRHGLSPAVPAPATAALPLPATSFVGRENDCAALAALLRTARLVTLHGPGGVGKTRLAAEVASRYPHDGVRFCDLASARGRADVLRSLTAAVGLGERAFHRLDDQLCAHLADQRLLFVIDNCDQVVAEIADVAELLLRRTREVVVLATSRRRLGVTGEHLWPVTPLATSGPDAAAVRLFVDRARAVVPHFGPSAQESEAISALCARLDGLPLAIELAAARLLGTTVAELSQNIGRGFRIIAADGPTESRHRSLRALIGWSYGGLSIVERRVFDCASVFEGPFDVSAAHAVCGGDAAPEDVLEALLRLADHSMVRVDRGESRAVYSMLETLRAHGRQRLEQGGTLDAVRDRHAVWAGELVARAADELGGPAEPTWAGVLDRHFADLRAAHHRLVGRDTGRQLALVAELHWYALWRGRSEVFRWAETGAAAAAGTHARYLPDALASAAVGAVFRGDLAAARAAARTATEAARAQPAVHAWRLPEAAGEIAIHGGSPEQAAHDYRAAYVLSMEAGAFLDATWNAASVGAALAYSGNTAEATRAARQADTAAAASGAPSALAIASWVAGEIAADTDPDEARSRLQLAAEHAETAGNRLVGGLIEVSLATLYGRNENPAAALRHYQRVIGMWQRAESWTPQWVTMRTLVDLLMRVGAWHDAAILHAAVRSADAATPAYGADDRLLRQAAARLRQHLRHTELNQCTRTGARMTASDTTRFALEAIHHARARI
ncbi:BTAD domain-containing putative transcriptional regulator [Amycolatopsis sp. GM8]|uniref:BTAD domain-containing putative transcriptional regulator n=1 Tax=Amycolatopsis sp. GM8 TaxID=2896530 RepID=UPI001F48DE94|nr:BTAD domain-containing putative transcriptional regulator [Amycolatopsis sp. GM8]